MTEHMVLSEAPQSFEIRPDPVDLISVGLSSTLCIVVDKIQDLVLELLEKQQLILDSVDQRNREISESEAVKRVHKTMIRTHQYYKKLLQMKKDMFDLHFKANKLKARAIKLKETQEQEAATRRAKLEKLIAKPQLPSAS